MKYWFIGGSHHGRQFENPGYEVVELLEYNPHPYNGNTKTENDIATERYSRYQIGRHCVYVHLGSHLRPDDIVQKFIFLETIVNDNGWVNTLKKRLMYIRKAMNEGDVQSEYIHNYSFEEEVITQLLNCYHGFEFNDSMFLRSEKKDRKSILRNVLDYFTRRSAKQVHGQSEENH